MFNIGLPDRLVQFEKHIQCPEVPLHFPKNGSRVLVSLGVASFTFWMRLGTLYSRSLRPVINTGRCYRTSNGHRISLSHRSEPSKVVFRPKICSARYIRPKIPVWIKKCLEWGFGYKKSEYEINFGRASRNGVLSPSDPQTPEPFNSPFRARNLERASDSNFAQNLGSVGQNLGSRSIHTQREKVNGEVKILLTCQAEEAN